MNRVKWPIAALFLATVAGACATPTPTATPTQPPAAAASPTKAPTATPTKRPVVKVRMVHSSKSLSYANLFVSFVKGYFLDEGIDVELINIPGGSSAIAALPSGSADFISSVADAPIQAMNAGTPAKIIAGHSKGDAVIVIMRKDMADRLGITPASKAEDKARALKGLTVSAQSQAGAGSNLVRFILGSVGLTDQNIEMTVIGDEAAMLAAMETKRIDVLSYTVPVTAKLTADGTAITLFSGAKGEVPGMPDDKLYNGITILESYGKANRDAVEGFVRGLWRGMRYARQDKAGFIEAASKWEFYRDLDPKLYQASIEEMYPTFVPDPTLTKDSIQKSIDYLNVFRATDQKLTIQAEQVFTNDYVEAAKKQLGF